MNKFVFDYIHTFSVVDVNIDESFLTQGLEGSSIVITSFKQSKSYIIKNSIDYELNQLGHQKILIPEVGMEVRVRNDDFDFYYETIEQLNETIRLQDHFLGTTYRNYGLRPFALQINGQNHYGTATVTYFGSNVFSLHFRIAITEKMEIDDAVSLGAGNLSTLKFVPLHTQSESIIGIDQLSQYYRLNLLSSLGSNAICYKSKLYHFLTGVDYWPNIEEKGVKNDVFYFLNQPCKRNSPLDFKDTYVQEYLRGTDASNFTNLVCHIGSNRGILGLGKIYDEIVKKDLLEQLDKIVFQTQMQYLIPLKKALGSYTILDGLREILENNVEFDVDQLADIKYLYEIVLKSKVFNEFFNFETVNELMTKIREALKYSVLEDRLEHYIETIDKVLDVKKKAHELRRQRMYGTLFSLTPLFLGITGVDKIVQFLVSVKWEVAQNHPLRLTAGLWATFILFGVTLYFVINAKTKVALKLNDIIGEKTVMLFAKKAVTVRLGVKSTGTSIFEFVKNKIMDLG